MTDEPNKAYYAVIPANVRYDKELPPNAKLLYSEITALCNQNGYCWATNEYFAKLYKCEIRTVKRWLSKLKEGGYISIQLERKEGSEEVERRYININIAPGDKNVLGWGQKCPEGGDKNVPYNITYINNINNERKKERYKERNAASYDQILSGITDPDLKALYHEFIKMRILIKQPMTDRALSLLISKVNKLEPLDIDRQKQMLETAILNNWKSVYPLKDEKKSAQPAQKPSGYNSFMDELAALRE